MMSVELISVLVAVVAVGITLAGLILTTVRGLRQEMRENIQGMRQEMRDMRQETRQEIQDLRGHMGRIDSHIGELRERLAHVEGLLKGLRESLVRRIAPN